ncbi:MAG: anhydro-N-acetylmuramic acid kinase [Robiginitomaculum sp.]|nr:MAG: anhydro-N-acetylmuramic acid kinase [Robiginitomaculum sp.]
MLGAGLMSGTSLDGMDAAIIETDGVRVIRQLGGMSLAYSTAQRQVLERVVSDALQWKFIGPAPDSFTPAAALLAEIGAEAIAQALKQTGLSSDHLEVIGFHGQTVLHAPPLVGINGQTCQIGDANQLAKLTSCKIIHDFRSADMAIGGHGAPLAPAWHFALARLSGQSAMVFLNIGGVSNLTFIPAQASIAQMVAFDCGPGNGPIDAWVQSKGKGTMDRDGAFAAQGQVDQTIVAEVLNKIPKPGRAASIDRWAFDHSPVLGLALEDGAATLSEITAQAIARGILALPERPEEVMVGGGGRYNPVLMERLQALVPCAILPCEAKGWNGDLIEAEAFAFLAIRRLAELPNSWPGTTGVSRPTVGGTICEPYDYS